MITIDYLKNHPELVETCARWSFNEWGKYDPTRPLEDYIESRKEYLNDNSLPLTFIALDGKTPVGMCSLAKTRGKWTDLTPWLAALYVKPEYRNQGIGKMLEQRVRSKAIEMGYQKIYLFTSDSSVIPWYEKLGWSLRQKDEYKGKAYVMEKKL